MYLSFLEYFGQIFLKFTVSIGYDFCEYHVCGWYQIEGETSRTLCNL